MKLALTIVATSLLPLLTFAAETAIYTYDALGRLVTATVSGGPNSGLNTTLVYDAASNRSTLTVTGTKNPGAIPIAVIKLDLPASAPTPLIIPILNPNNR